MFINELSQRFDTENYKPLIAISNIIISTEKPQIADVFFDLGPYRQEIEDMDDLENEPTSWYRYKVLHLLKTIPEVHKEFAKKDERAFSCLKRVKTRLRSTMNQNRLSSMAIINIHTIVAGQLNIDTLIDIFASVKERRLIFH